MNELQELWTIDTHSLTGLTAGRARDLLVECFLHAQRETVVRAKTDIGLQSDETAVRLTVQGHVRAAFSACGGDYDSPTCESLTAVVAALAQQSRTTGMPKRIVQHHEAQMRKVIDAL